MSQTKSDDEAVQALFSKLHQSTSKEAIAKAAARRTSTVSDMRRYWSRVRWDEKPPLPRRIIHITGTKGKGSTACMCQEILRHHGYSTGLFTSPHLVDIRERIRWNGQPVHPTLFGDAYWKIRRDLESYTQESGPDKDELPTLPGYFRMLTLMAFYIFTKLDLDVWIVEVGMGGRYDATNFIDRPAHIIDGRSICGITLLDLDHTRILGTTLPQIAWEKAGIVAIDKADTTSISPKPDPTRDSDALSRCTGSEQSDSKAPVNAMYILDSNGTEVVDVCRQCAALEGKGTPVRLVDASGTDVRTKLSGRALGLAGKHQFGNAELAVRLCHDVSSAVDMQDYGASYDAFLCNQKTLDGLSSAQWPGRCQTVQRPPHITLRLDGAHTPQSLASTVDWFMEKSNPNSRRVLVFHCSHERHPIELLSLLSQANFAEVHFAKPDTAKPSPVSVPTIQELLESAGMPPEREPTGDATLEEISWQDKLGILWDHIGQPHHTQNNGTTCNRNAEEIVRSLYETSQESTEVLVTGSLYLVGSFLNAIEWQEEYSSSDLS
eukprot:Nitzschia sp. Nitz4//scaffold5_size260463//78182//79828//NITZ4_000965-RA/size260463-processed-gene-0.308-mRNA-1//1//CDS//3329555289//9099//frame0